MDLALTVLLPLTVIALLVLRSIVHIVPDYQRLAVFRLGAFERMAGPGIVLLLPPPIQTIAQTVDLRESVIELREQTCVTEDNVPVLIDLLVHHKIVDPAEAVLKVENFRAAILAAAAKQLRSAVSETPSEFLFAERDQIADEVSTTLGETSRSWGVQITNVELKGINMRTGVKGAS